MKYREVYNKVKYKILFFSLMASVLFSSYLLLYSHPTAAKREVNISLKGNYREAITLNTEYIDDGITLAINNEEINLEDVNYTVKDNINKDVIGSYEVVYEVNYEDKNYSLVRKVDVIDNVSPIIEVEKEIVERFQCSNGIKDNLSYKAYDNYDGILTEKVKVVEEADGYHLSVVDSSNNETSIIVPIENTADASPSIQLNGTEMQYIKVGDTYVEEGAKLINPCGKEVAGEITISGNVDTAVPGTYPVLYSYTYNGKNSKKIRNVIVYQKEEMKTNTFQGDKVIFLTFDDGPGQYTEELLEILNKYNVKATFFVTNQFSKYVSLIQKEAEYGHAIGVHSLTHKWNIYRSVENYIKDFNDMNLIIEKYTGKKTSLFRFPGGGSNTVSRGHAKGIMGALANRMNELGYVYYDWNVDSEDAAYASKDKIVTNVKNGIQNRNYSVVLMHDIKRNTIDAIEEIIVYALENGYHFETLTETSPTVHHHLNN